jgi:ubiquinone/menaquinone biosynthesis C-methylase UbiE
MKLTDPTNGLKRTALEQVRLPGESLSDLSDFWDEAARVDTVRSIADSDDETSFETSGHVDAADVLAIAPENAVILEIGSGTGRIMQHLAQAAAEVHGVDISTEMVERGSARLAHLPNVHFHKSNGYDLGTFADETFDVVFSWVVFQHVPKTVAYNYLTEARRVLKPGGKVRLQVPNILRSDHFNAFRHFSQPYFVQYPYPMNFYTAYEIFKMLGEAGLPVDELDDRIVVVAHRPVAGEADRFDDWRRLMGLPEVAPLRDRIHELEGEVEQARSDVTTMRRVYDHPAVRAARWVRRTIRGPRPGSPGQP